MYSWTVDLSRFGGAAQYPDYFNRLVTPADVEAFEDEFRAAIDGAGSFEIAGEVCFWKNHGNYLGRNRITQRLIDHLSSLDNWHGFARTIRRTANDPSHHNFVALREACGQKRGFATPMTFLAFYHPTDYPMADKNIANWWAVHRARYGFGSAPDFFQRNDGLIEANTIRRTKQNWSAYLAWKRFCCDYAARIAEHCGLNWRARDVEMAVWEAEKKRRSLGVLP